MKQHKWHKEIKAWADGTEIECREIFANGDYTDWWRVHEPEWDMNPVTEYRIKPQDICKCQKQTCSALKEPQYLYVYKINKEIKFCEPHGIIEVPSGKQNIIKLGKIKLEVDDD